MKFIKSNGVYDFLMSKFNEIYELPQKPEDPLMYLKLSLDVLSVDKQFLINEIKRYEVENDNIRSEKYVLQN